MAESQLVRRPKGVDAVWDELVPLIPNLSEGHAKILADFCRVITDLESQHEKLREEGWVIEGKIKGVKVKNPRMQAVRELRQAVQRYSDMFGLNPTAAFRLAGEVKKPSKGASVLDGNWKPPATERQRVN